MRALIYKRTHADATHSTCAIGSEDCLGQIRDSGYDIVIGVHGAASLPDQNNLAGKISWIGRHPIPAANPIDCCGPLITFEPFDFRRFEDQGPLLSSVSSILARKLSESRAGCFVSSMDPEELREVAQLAHLILDLKRFDHLQVSLKSRISA